MSLDDIIEYTVMACALFFVTCLAAFAYLLWSTVL